LYFEIVLTECQWPEKYIVLRWPSSSKYWYMSIWTSRLDCTNSTRITIIVQLLPSYDGNFSTVAYYLPVSILIKPRYCREGRDSFATRVALTQSYQGILLRSFGLHGVGLASNSSRT